MTPHREDSIDISDNNTACKFGNGEKTEAKGQGNAVLNSKDEGKGVANNTKGCYVRTISTIPNVLFGTPLLQLFVCSIIPKVVNLQLMSHGLSPLHNHYTCYKVVVAIK